MRPCVAALLAALFVVPQYFDSRIRDPLPFQGRPGPELLRLRTQDDPASLIDKLRSDSPAEREEAAKKLRALGRAALPQLEKAAKDPDGEVAARARRLVRLVPILETLTPKFLSVMKGAEERLAAGDEHSWTEVFLEAAAEESDMDPVHPSLRRRELEPLAARALRAATSSDEKRFILAQVTKHRLRSAIPEAVKALRDPESGVREHALDTLLNLRAKEALGEIAGCLVDRSETVRGAAVDVVWGLGRREALPLLLPSFKDESPDVRRTLMARIRWQVFPEVFPSLRKLLQDPDPGVRCAAAEGLGSAGAAEALPEIRALLRDEQKSVRQAAINALGMMRSREDIPLVLPGVEDEDVQIRHAVRVALVRMRARETIPELRRRFTHPNQDVRRSVILTLQDLGAWEAIPDLVAWLSDPHEDVREAAAVALGRLEARTAVPALMKASEDGNADVRSKAAEALGVLGSCEAVPALVRFLADDSESVRKEALDALGAIRAEQASRAVLALIADKSPRVASQVPDVLGTLQMMSLVPDLMKKGEGESAAWRVALALHAMDAPEALKVLEGRAADVSSNRREEMLSTIEDRRDRRAIPFLLGRVREEVDVLLRARAFVASAELGYRGEIPEWETFVGHPSPRVRGHSLYALRLMESRVAIPQVLERMDGEGPRQREAIAAYVAYAGGPQEIPSLIRFLGEDPAGVREVAASGLARLGAKEAVAPLLALLDASEESVRTAAADALAGLGAREALPAILGLFRDESEEVRYKALWAAMDLAGKEEVPKFAALLEDPHSSVRANAALALAWLGSRGSIPAIVKRLKDEDFVARLALHALAALDAEESVPSVAGLLGHPDSLIRREAIETLAILEGRVSAARFVPLLSDEKSDVRQAASVMLVRMGSREVVGAVTGLLKHEWGDVRKIAAETLGRLGDSSAVGPLLKDPDFEVRAAAAEALGTKEAGDLVEDREPLVRAGAVKALVALGRRDEVVRRASDEHSFVREAAAAVGIETLLSDSHRDVRVAALRGWSRFKGKESVAAIAPLLADPALVVRRAAAEELARWGDRRGLWEIQRGIGDRSILNACRQPGLWTKLEKAVLPETAEGRPREVAARIAKAAGLDLEWPRTPFREGGLWSGPHVRGAAGKTLLEALAETVRAAQMEFVLEKDRIRVLNRDAAFEVWKDLR